MNRITIIGSGGAGKSTLSVELGQLLGLPVVHLDSLYWTKGWVNRSEDEFERILNEVVTREQWIIDGNYSSTMDVRFSRAEAIIYLDYPTWICLFRILKRRIQYHGKARPDMVEGCKEKIDMEFIKWILNFRRNKRPSILNKLSNVESDKKIYIFKTPKELKNYIKNLKENL